MIKSFNRRADAAGNSTLEVWDDNIVRYGADIIKKRYNLLTEFTAEFKSYVSGFFKGVKVDLFYVFSWDRGDSSDDFINYADTKNSGNGKFYGR